MSSRPALSVVVPALDAAVALPATLASIVAARRDIELDLTVVDGGSTDDTVVIARHFGARVVVAPRGRGAQLSAGAAATHGDWLLFVHADTVLGAEWPSAARAFAATGSGRAGWLRFALDDPSPAARRLERLVAWRCRVLALPYGDQGLLLARSLYDAVGGYRPLPLMEDIDLVRRLGRHRIAPVAASAITSAERWRRQGYLRRSARNLACLALWHMGVPARAIARLYG
ncbi:MAG: glycosyltransferase [Alphaproteobacteria bacterium]|nr:glycosyltransferase [Alphaproteobacteria bacterium]